MTKIIPAANINSAAAFAQYLTFEDERLFDEEFLCSTENNQLTLIAECHHALRPDEKPTALIWYWPNYLWPMYTLSLYWHGLGKQIISFRAFLLTDTQALDLMFSKPTRVVILKKAKCVAAIELDIPNADDSLWGMLAGHGEKQLSFHDAKAAKIYVMGHLRHKKTAEQELEYGWAKRLELAASTAIRFYKDCTPDHADELEKVKRSSFKAFFEDQENPAMLLYQSFNALFWEQNKNPIAILTDISRSLSEAPFHDEFIKHVLQYAWFSGEGTSWGREICSIDIDGTFKKIPVNPISMGNCVKHFWDRIPFLWPFYFDMLLGPGSCPMDLLELTNAFPSYKGNLATGAEFTKNLLAEAVSLKRWTIPAGAYVQFEIGSIKAIKLYELNDDIACIFVDQSGHYFLVWVNPSRQQFSFCYDDRFVESVTIRDTVEAMAEELYQGSSSPQGIGQKGDLKEALEAKMARAERSTRKPESLERFELGFKVILAAMVRDFWVVEERERVFGASVLTRRMARLRSDWKKKTIVYLPRIKYVGDVRGRGEELNLVARKPHFVVGHLRKAVHASENQMFLAKRYSIVVPEGFTFVRPHKRGDKAQEQIYRSRSALQCIRSLDPLPLESGRDAWFAYELNVKKWLESNEYEVEHLAGNRNGDGGVDIQARSDRDFVRVDRGCKATCNSTRDSIYRTSQFFKYFRQQNLMEHGRIS